MPSPLALILTPAMYCLVAALQPLQRQHGVLLHALQRADDVSHARATALVQPHQVPSCIVHELLTCTLALALTLVLQPLSMWRSHQHVLCMLLAEHASRTGLRVDVLPQRLFAIGQQYHRKRAFMRALVKDVAEPRPFLFHWSWTAGKHEKLK